MIMCNCKLRFMRIFCIIYSRIFCIIYSSDGIMSRSSIPHLWPFTNDKDLLAKLLPPSMCKPNCIAFCWRKSYAIQCNLLKKGIGLTSFYPEAVHLRFPPLIHDFPHPIKIQIISTWAHNHMNLIRLMKICSLYREPFLEHVYSGMAIFNVRRILVDCPCNLISFCHFK